jgi:hypothetical protein
MTFIDVLLQTSHWSHVNCEIAIGSTDICAIFQEGNVSFSHPL